MNRPYFHNKARLNLGCYRISHIQLYLKSGFIFYNNFDSGIYYSTLGGES